MSAGQISNETFNGLAFPVVRVRYAGPTNCRGSRWIATLRRDNERSFRAIVPYRSEMPDGSINALRGALACFAKSLQAIDSDTSVNDYVAIPGDLNAATYSFTFVPSYILNRS